MNGNTNTQGGFTADRVGEITQVSQNNNNDFHLCNGDEFAYNNNSVLYNIIYKNKNKNMSAYSNKYNSLIGRLGYLSISKTWCSFSWYGSDATYFTSKNGSTWVVGSGLFGSNRWVRPFAVYNDKMYALSKYDKAVKVSSDLTTFTNTNIYADATSLLSTWGLKTCGNSLWVLSWEGLYESRDGNTSVRRYYGYVEDIDTDGTYMYFGDWGGGKKAKIIRFHKDKYDFTTLYQTDNSDDEVHAIAVGSKYVVAGIDRLSFGGNGSNYIWYCSLKDVTNASAWVQKKMNFSVEREMWMCYLYGVYYYMIDSHNLIISGLDNPTTWSNTVVRPRGMWLELPKLFVSHQNDDSSQGQIYQTGGNKANYPYYNNIAYIRTKDKIKSSVGGGATPN